MIDSHCHITCDPLYSRLPEIESSLKDFHGILVVCTNEEEFERALELKQRDKKYKIAFGWYPGDAKEVSEKRLQYLEMAIQAGHVDVLGEIGLDYHWDTSFKEEQKALFKVQIEMANQYHLPIAIHMRDAAKDTLDHLKEAKTKIIFHCFSGSVETMKECLKLDSFISFAGPVTYKNAKHALDCVKVCPKERILIETDSPYLPPHPLRGTQNEPKNVELVLNKIAELKNADKTELEKQIEHNFDSIFQK